jgi:hypothetical protein
MNQLRALQEHAPRDRLLNAQSPVALRSTPLHVTAAQMQYQLGNPFTHSTRTDFSKCEASFEVTCAVGAALVFVPETDWISAHFEHDLSAGRSSQVCPCIAKYGSLGESLAHFSAKWAFASRIAIIARPVTSAQSDMEPRYQRLALEESWTSHVETPIPELSSAIPDIFWSDCTGTPRVAMRIVDDSLPGMNKLEQTSSRHVRSEMALITWFEARTVDVQSYCDQGKGLRRALAADAGNVHLRDELCVMAEQKPRPTQAFMAEPKPRPAQAFRPYTNRAVASTSTSTSTTETTPNFKRPRKRCNPGYAFDPESTYRFDPESTYQPKRSRSLKWKPVASVASVPARQKTELRNLKGLCVYDCTTSVLFAQLVCKEHYAMRLPSCIWSGLIQNLPASVIFVITSFVLTTDMDSLLCRLTDTDQRRVDRQMEIDLFFQGTAGLPIPRDAGVQGGWPGYAEWVEAILARNAKAALLNANVLNLGKHIGLCVSDKGVQEVSGQTCKKTQAYR